jgi:tartrate-resistant acid phosphatase type 5
VALGNHDYGEVDNPQDDPKCPKDSTADCFYSPLHQLDVRLSHRDSRWHCERSFSVKLANGDVEIFFLDTTPINDNYHSKVWASNRAGIFEQSWEAQVAELGSKLKQSQARWKFVVGHHPIRSNHRADLLYPDMVQRVEPLLLQYKVSAYFAGHDHNLQFRKQGGLVPYAQIVSGAGSAIGKGFYSDEDAPFQATVNGFAAVEMAGELTKVEYYGLDSDEPLFVGEVRKPQF